MSLDEAILSVVAEKEPHNLHGLIRGVRAEKDPQFVGLAYICDRTRSLLHGGLIARDLIPDRYGRMKNGPFHLTEAGFERLTRP